MHLVIVNKNSFVLYGRLSPKYLHELHYNEITENAKNDYLKKIGGLHSFFSIRKVREHWIWYQPLQLVLIFGR